MKEPVDHVLRPRLPWRSPSDPAITECGYDASKVKTITLPSGTLTARAGRTSIVKVDEDAAVAWCSGTRTPDQVATKPQGVDSLQSWQPGLQAGLFVLPRQIQRQLGIPG
mgnify:CR=1 FL=1